MDTTTAAFDLSIEETSRWLNDIEAGLGGSRAAAFAGLKAILAVLKDRLPLEVSTRFASELPVVLATIYLSGPAGDGLRNDRIGDQIRERLPPAVSLDGETVGRSVLKAIRGRIGLTEFRKVLAHLPREVREQWLDDYVCGDAGEIAAAKLAITKSPDDRGANHGLRAAAARLRGWNGVWGAALGRAVTRGNAIAGTLERRSPAALP